jgi:hypothetical protein
VKTSSLKSIDSNIQMFETSVSTWLNRMLYNFAQHP